VQPFVDLLVAAACCGVVAKCPADANCDNNVTVADMVPFIDILLGNPPCAPSTQGLLCNPPPEENEGGGGQGEAGGGESGGGQSQDVTAPADAANPSAEPQPPQPDEPIDPVFEARWNTFVDWLNANPPEAWPEFTEDQWDAMAAEMMLDLVYAGVAP